MESSFWSAGHDKNLLEKSNKALDFIVGRWTILQVISGSRYRPDIPGALLNLVAERFVTVLWIMDAHLTCLPVEFAK
jgi:hypothetical protein